MKIDGKPRQILNPRTGKLEWSYHPATKEEAIAEDVAKYRDFVVCPIHDQENLVFVRTGIRTCCAQHDVAAVYNEARALGEPLSAHLAVKAGKDYYFDWRPGKRCGHPGKLTLKGDCYICSKEDKTKTPRQQALEAKKAWYMPAPGDTCKRGHYAERSVHNGECRQCIAERRELERDAASNIHKIHPEMVIDKETARSLGFKVYRTGQPCSKGHLGWRYVSSGTCLTCMGRD